MWFEMGDGRIVRFGLFRETLDTEVLLIRRVSSLGNSGV